jgi:ATPase subunit of ABC transporter with duplicated ATPase domains
MGPEQRPSPEEALARVQAYIAALQAENVPTALVEERVTDICKWGEGVRLRRAGHGAPREEMRGIQSRLDELRKSEDYVRALRPNENHYPYDTEEQARLAKLLNQMDISKADREALFKTLHGGDGLRSLLADDLQSVENRRRLSARAIDECAKKMTRYDCEAQECHGHNSRPRFRTVVFAAWSGTRTT